MINTWAKAALIRATKAAVQASTAEFITSAAAFSEVNWLAFFDVFALTFVFSILTSIAGVPEVANGENLAKIIESDPLDEGAGKGEES